MWDASDADQGAFQAVQFARTLREGRPDVEAPQADSDSEIWDDQAEVFAAAAAANRDAVALDQERLERRNAADPSTYGPDPVAAEQSDEVPADRLKDARFGAADRRFAANLDKLAADPGKKDGTPADLRG
jgi:hypothetical protein